MTKKKMVSPKIVVQPEELLVPEVDEFYNVPTGSASNLVMEVLSSGENVGDLPDRKQQISRSTQMTVLESGKKRLVSIKSTKCSISVELADIEKMTGTNKPAKKLFVLAMIKANEQAIHNGQLGRNYVSFPVKELVDIGFYKTPQSARKGFDSGADALTSLKIRGTVEETKKKKQVQMTLEVLFTGAHREKGQCILYLNERINWGFIAQYFTILPKYYFSLSNRASELLYYIFYLARQNTKDIAEKGHFNISFRAIQARLQLPSEVMNENPYKTIKKPIEDALEEIEKGHNCYYGGQEFGLLPVADDNAPIKEYLDKGYLKVTLSGSFAASFLAISEGTKKQIEQSNQRKARIEEKAIAMKTAQNMKDIPEQNKL